ncbi:MAG: hypothetical protein QOH25_356 [Acidobacteriota bacterium]|jgi:hypothetical protein|nr:hypothetical protein [Acidobacteriota bacterium]
MKKNWQAVLMIIALNIVFGGMSGALAQQVPIAGGYAETSRTDPEVVSAARFAVRAAGRKAGARVTLLSIEHSEVQVVAGLNYMLRLKVKVNGQSQDVTAVVYRNLKDKYSLSSWEAAGNHAGSSGSASSSSTIEQLAQALADAFTAKSLGRLDAERPYFGRVKIIIEHSLAEDTAKDRFEVRQVRTLEQGERWLTSRERADSPARNSGSLQRCRKGVCTYEQVGMLHNNLYLQKVTYGYRNRRPYIKTIYLIDGD